MLIHLGTTGDDYIETTAGEDDLVFAGAQNDRIRLSSGNDVIDGGQGFDQLFYTSNFGQITYVLTDTSFVGAGVNTVFASIEAFVFTATNSLLITIDASDWAPAGGNPAGYTLIQAYGGNSRITGSAYSDTVYVDGRNNVIDTGGGFDRVYASPVGKSEPYYISTIAGALRIMQGDADDEDRTVLTITNAEMVGVAANYDTTVDQTVIATGSAMGVHFIDGFSSDTFVGSAHDDLFDSTSPFPVDQWIDTFTGGGGADTFSFIGGAHRLDQTYITDFSADDVIDFNGNTAAGYEISTFIGSAAFSGATGEYRYQIGGGQTIIQFDGDGDGVADGTLYLLGSNARLEQVTTAAGTKALHIDPAIYGTAGNDIIDGTIDADEIHGLGGDDTIDGLAGDDLINGGGGNDTIDGGDGGDQLYGNAGDDMLSGDAGADKLYGHAGNDTVEGGAGNDNVFGGNDNDSLYGGDGDDLVNGQGGDDVIVGGPGNDLLVGGFGADRFVFSDGDLGIAAPATDRIKDFLGAQGDTIDLHLMDADTTTGGDQAFTWISTYLFSGTAGELRFQYPSPSAGIYNTRIYGDTDGDGAADFVLELTGNVTPSQFDFIL